MELYIRIKSQAVSNRLSARRKSHSLTKSRFGQKIIRSKKRLIRYGLLTANLALLLAVILFVTKSPAGSQLTRQDALASASSSENTVGPLDQVSSADIAVHIARASGLPEATSVVNHADSVSAIEASAPADVSVVAKPQVVSTALPSRKDIHSYTTVDGDSIGSIAGKFGISSDSIRWSNDLTGNNVVVGKKLILPPAGVNGIVYIVKAGDTAESLAQKYGTEKDLLVSFNDAEVGGFKPGEQILIPNGVVVQTVVRATYSYSSNFAWGGSSPVYNDNGYDYGWCTWHAANRRREIGRPIPSNLGNASSWMPLARSAGLATGSTPQAGAVFSQAGTGYLGHVGFVERVNDDGSFEASDMNYPIWGRATRRTVSVSELGSYKFIY